MSDKFFTQESCDRCRGDLQVRTMSWFNDDTICHQCFLKEYDLRNKLPNRGRELEGCGYLPTVKYSCK